MTRTTPVTPETTANSAGTAFSPTMATTSGAFCAAWPFSLEPPEPVAACTRRTQPCNFSIARGALSRNWSHLALQHRGGERDQSGGRSDERDQHEKDGQAARHHSREPADREGE